MLIIVDSNTKYFVTMQMEPTVAFLWQQWTILYGSPLYIYANNCKKGMYFVFPWQRRLRERAAIHRCTFTVHMLFDNPLLHSRKLEAVRFGSVGGGGNSYESAVCRF